MSRESSLCPCCRSTVWCAEPAAEVKARIERWEAQRAEQKQVKK